MPLIVVRKICTRFREKEKNGEIQCFVFCVDVALFAASLERKINTNRDVISTSSPILVEQATQIMLDSVICVKGNVNPKGMFFATHIILPDIPSKPISSQNYADETVHVAFLSDIHVGSKGFLDKPMDKFIDFLNGKAETLHLQKLGKNTKYVMFSGDVVDGVGIYPGQLDELAMDSIHDQYDAFGSFLERIPGLRFVSPNFFV